jgi:K+-transporting ATPase ATPase C chain
MSSVRPALVMLVSFTLLTGGLYPALVTAAAQVLFPYEANGSLLQGAEGIRGSSWIGQPFEDPAYFWSRPSATAPFAYNAAASSGSNLGPLHPALQAAIAKRVATLRAADPGNTSPVPVDLVTSSGSGLDPHISPEAAKYQVARVARVRNVDRAQLRTLIANHTEGRAFGLLGEPRVHVLELNLALDALGAR